MATNKKPTSNKPKPNANRTAGTSINICVKANKNNTIITIADSRGNTLCQSSGGKLEKGARKRTAHAAKEAGKDVARLLVNKKIKATDAKVFIKGNGNGRDPAVLGVYEVLNQLSIKLIVDRTGRAHGGVRKRKARRI